MLTDRCVGFNLICNELELNDANGHHHVRDSALMCDVGHALITLQSPNIIW
jgi:hypothetical protein